MKCSICNERIKKKGFSDLLNKIELKRFKEIRKDKKNICFDCKTDLLYSNLVSSYK
jgi:hypothetical protein